MCKLEREKKTLNSQLSQVINHFLYQSGKLLFVNFVVFLVYLSFRTNNETPEFSMTTTVNRVERVTTQPWDSTTGLKTVPVTK